jgi:hypothetical protein
MDRQTLDSLYAGSRGSPARLFMRIASMEPLDADAYGFLLDHVQELDVDVLITFFNARRADDVQPSEKPFVKRLAGLAAAADASALLKVLRLSPKISSEAWLEDLTLPLRERLPPYRWWRFVDKVRGGMIFNALNVGIPRSGAESSWDPEERFVTSIEEARTQPRVVPLLDRSHDDRAAAEFALKELPVIELVELHRKLPELITLDSVNRVAASRVDSSSESWATSRESTSLPEWLAPLVVERLRTCDEQEAHVLYEWLFALPAGAHQADGYGLALARFERAPLERFWHARIGTHLGTGASWKTRGRTFIDLCIRLGRGIPPGAIRAALDAAAETDGASVEKHRESILKKIHDETAKLLIERAEVEFNARKDEAGDLFLSAFMSLEPGSFISGALHRLGRRDDLPSDIVARVHACASLARAGRRAPTEDALYEAFLVLTGQSS